MDVNLNSITGVPYSQSFGEFTPNPIILIIFSVVIIGYYALFASLGVAKGAPVASEAGKAGKGIVFMEILLWAVFILLLFLNGAAYIFNMDVTAYIRNIFSPTADLDIVVDTKNIAGDKTETPEPVPEIKLKKQVFHIPGNNYVYEDAKAICKAYGGKLASWKQMSDAYDKGADWCSYGWSEEQMALFPTQYDKWKNLQKIPGHKHDCGRPGINGGYIKNPNVRYGANCYGYKPKITEDEAEMMETTSPYPVTRKEIEFDKRVDYWQSKIPEMLVAPFNYNNWSVI